jgi:5-methylthioadenosine/S-adenosylhomocysteine deaminase
VTNRSQLRRRDLISLVGGAAAALSFARVAPVFGQARSATAEFIVRGAHVLTMEPGSRDLPRGDVHVRNGVIVAIGERLAAPKAKIIDGTDRIVMPGFVDTHWHLWNTFMRGLIRADDRVNGYFPTTLRLGPFCTPDDAYKSVRFSVAEAFLSGITTLHDWAHNICSPEHADAELQALTDCGIRARFSYGTPQGLPGDKQMDIADLGRVQRRWAREDGMLSLGAAVRTPGPGPRGAVSIDTVASEIASLRKMGLPFTIHGGGKATIGPLAGRNLLGPDLLMVHAQGMTAEELQAIGETKTNYSISPVIEMSYSAVRNGYIQFAELEALHVPLCLSIDSSGASANADFFNIMRALLWSNWRRTDTNLKLQYEPKRLVELATIEGARRLGVGDITGSLKVGKRADLITIRTSDINMSPLGDPYFSLVFSGQPSNVDLVVANGEIVAQGGKRKTIDVAKTIREAKAAADALAARAPRG